MPKKKPLVVVTRRLPDNVETRMRELFDAKLNVDDRPLSQAELVDAVRSADVLVPTVTDRIDATLLARAARLRIVANVAVGYDNIDVGACAARGVVVTNTPGVLTEATADLAFGLLRAAVRHPTP